MSSKLNENFLAELFKLMFINPAVMKVCAGYLNYTLIPKEEIGYKVVLRDCLEQFQSTGKLPSLGVIAQKYAINEQVQKTINEIKDANAVDYELIINQLEEYIRDSEFTILSKRVYDLFQEGKKAEAIQVNFEESQRILNISLRQKGGKFKKVFADFHENIKENIEESSSEKNNSRVLFGIDALDDFTEGGGEITDTVLWIMRSGVGKSTVLRYHGLAAALNGEPVLHIQAEGSQKQVLNKYDQMWTSMKFGEVRRGNIPPEKLEAIDKTIAEMALWGKDVDVYAFEKFGDASMLEVRNLILEYHKINGYFPKVVILDSLDLIVTGENKKVDTDPAYIKYKLQKCAQRFKDLATEFGFLGITATQAGDVSFDIWNDPDKVITRNNTEGDRTLVKPFSFVFTGNVTLKEGEENLLRIYCDKLRDYKNNGKIFKIATDYDHGRFYDRRTTMELYMHGEDSLPAVRENKRRKTNVV